MHKGQMEFKGRYVGVLVNKYNLLHLGLVV